MTDKEDYGHATVGYGTPKERKIPIIEYLQAEYTDNRIISVSELENNEGFIIAVENIGSSGRSSQKMFLSRESFIGMISTIMLFFTKKDVDFDKLLKEAVSKECIDFRTSFR